MNYKVVSCPTIERQRLDELSYDDKFKIMKQATSSDRLATNILKAYPNFIADVVMHSDEELDNGIIDIKNIFGVGSKYYKVYKRVLREKYLYFGFTNREELKKYELTVEDAKAIFKKYPHADDGSVAIEKHPYRVLIGLCGHSFDKVDKLLKSARSDLIDSDERCEAVVLDILHKNESEGNSRLNGSKLYMVMRDDYNCPELHKRLLNVCKNSEELYYDEPTKDISIMSTYMKEVNIASYVKSANEDCEELDFNVEDYRVLDNGIELTDEQLKAVENFKKYRFSIVDSPAGSGKSTSAKSIVEVCKHLGLSLTILAPTGVASMRISETTNHPASTIHLKCLKDGEISTDVLLVDENSMIDLDVYNMMFNCITNDKIRIVLMGDCNQISPIGVGTVYADLVKSKVVPITTFTKVFRYGNSGIAYANSNTRQGKDFFDDDVVKYNGDTLNIMNDWEFIQRGSDEAIRDEIISQYRKLIKNGVKKSDIMVLSAYNVMDCGTYILNDMIQSEFNPPKVNEKIFERKLRGC
jgi:exodeoxyribonuclease V alpha subunit